MRMISVEEKDGSRMTIVELSKVIDTRFIGFIDGDSKRYLLSSSPEGPIFVCAGGWRNSNDTYLGLLTAVKDVGTFHVFDTAKELYEWMAE